MASRWLSCRLGLNHDTGVSFAHLKALRREHQGDSEVTAAALLVLVLQGVTFSWELYDLQEHRAADAQPPAVWLPATAEDLNPASLLMRGELIG